ncbi:phosphoglycerate mutase [Acetobacter nitrogenifigens DSM 23921 = NBRC 105050]|nr:histidine phosphatase family protein [Acetobacter nitrogenifigens]GBQ88402.1 phosphoglycerate mutase [Acetobacter nitrogenifigens DSM 23921 = NBRC 105050]
MIVLRHCESEFNRLFTATRRDPGISDPPLSTHGLAQADALVTALAGQKIRRILVSPFTRALQTAAPVARALSLTPQVRPLIRERAAFSCDIGSPPAQLALQWPGLDFSGLEEQWWTEGVETPEEVEERAALFRAEMAADPEWPHTLVVSHWGFLVAFARVSMENGSWRRLDPTAPLTH